MSIKHIIFDMDGTLSNTAIATAAAIKQVNDKYNLPKITDEHIRNTMGIGGLEFHATLFPTLPMETLLKVEQDVDRLEEEHIVKMGEKMLFDGVKDMLAKLTARQNITIHIASTGSKRHVHATLTATGIYDLFTSISCDEPAKIDMVKKIVGNSDPAGWAMVGDMYKDSEAARGNGILALGAEFGYLVKENFSLFDYVLSVPGDIFQYMAC